MKAMVVNMLDVKMVMVMVMEMEMEMVMEIPFVQIRVYEYVARLVIFEVDSWVSNYD